MFNSGMDFVNNTEILDVKRELKKLRKAVEKVMGFGSTTEDHDGVPKTIDRGPPEEDRKTEAELRGAMRDINKAKMSMGEIATLKGIQEEMAVHKAMMDDMLQQHNKVMGMVQTMQGKLNQFEQQWNIERQSWLAKGGSTTPEDN